MSRSKWLFVGLAALIAGCATGSEEVDEGAGAGDAAGDVAAPHDATSEGGNHPGGDAAGDATTGADVTTPPGDDSSTGDDGAGDDGNADANAPDATIADGGVDANAPDTNVPDHNAPDTNVPDTNVPDTNVPDTNVPDTNVPDVSAPDAGCSPVGKSFTKTYHAPAIVPFACTASDAQGYYDACFGTSATGTKCNAWLSANATCGACLDGTHSSPTSSTWGPEVDWPLGATDAVAEVNFGGCLVADTGVTSTCAKDLQYRMECEHAVCDSSCASAGFTSYQACAQAADADATLCKSYVDAVSSQCAGVTSSACDFPPPASASFETLFLKVAAVFCE